MTGAKVNGKIVPITYKLKTGEICEVLTSNQPGKGPSRDWLKVVTTGEARSKIRSWFKKERRDENIVQGKAEVDRELRRNFIRLDGEQYDAFLQRIAERQHCASVEDFYATVGYGGLVISRMMPGIKDEYNATGARRRSLPNRQKPRKRPRKSGGSSGGVIVEGIDNCLINMARCCAPVPVRDHRLYHPGARADYSSAGLCECAARFGRVPGTGALGQGSVGRFCAGGDHVYPGGLCH